MPLSFIKRIVLFSIFIFCLNFTSKAEGNLPYVDEKLIHFGFSLGFNNMDFGVTESGSTLDMYSKARSTSGDPIYTLIGQGVYHASVSTLSPGFSVGLITDLRINRYLNLRFAPTLNFASRELRFSEIGTSGINHGDTIHISSTPICLPIYLKYSAERKDNYRPYLIWGVGTYYDLSSSDVNPYLQLNKIDFYTEFGVGCDIYFSFFKLCPELKFCIGLGNNNMLNNQPTLKKPEDMVYTKAISRLTSRMLTLTFNFE